MLDVSDFSPFPGVARAAVCLCGSGLFAVKDAARRSHVFVQGVGLGPVLPLTVLSRAGAPADVGLPWLPAWASSFTDGGRDSPMTLAWQVLGLQCGGVATRVGQLWDVILPMDPDVVFLQELWGADLDDRDLLDYYVVVCSDLQRRGRGLGFLLHLRLALQYNTQDPQSHVVVVSDTRCLFALLMSYQSSAVLLCSVHVDPSLPARAVEDVLRSISDLDGSIACVFRNSTR